MSLSVTLQVGEAKWASNGMYVPDATGNGERCTEVTTITFDNQETYDRIITIIRGSRIINNLDPDTGLPIVQE